MEPHKIYMTIIEFARENSRRGWPTYAALRNMRRDRFLNGFETAFINVGKRVLIDVNEFWNCVERRAAEKKEKTAWK